MASDERIAARIGILLAAGRGRRMGRTKQLLPWQTPDGLKPLVAAAFDAVAPACDAVVVVLGHDADRVRAALAPRECHPVMGDPDAEMFASVRVGIREARRIDAAANVLLHPGDHPQVGPETLELLATASRAHPERAVMPEHDGKGGHPVLIPARLIDAVLAFRGPGGLSAFWAAHPDHCLRIEVNDLSVVRDVDTSADLET